MTFADFTPAMAALFAATVARRTISTTGGNEAYTALYVMTVELENQMTRDELDAYRAADRAIAAVCTFSYVARYGVLSLASSDPIA